MGAEATLFKEKEKLNNYEAGIFRDELSFAFSC
jgi:hypothetical protein